MAICAAAVTLASIGMFAVTAHKTVALTVNGETKNVTTYATSVPRLLQEQGVKIKTHDFIDSTNENNSLSDHDVITVRSAYQTTINIDGQEVPFWTYATSADQLLGFFKTNDQNATKISVDVGNIYNQLTGGFVINKEGPVTVIADGKTSIAPNGKLTAASILDSKNINIGKEDRVNVSEENGQTILRVQRVTHGQETKDTPMPFSTRTVVDPSLQPGQTEIRQVGHNGNKEQIYDVTYVDGQAESSTLKSETVTQAAIDQVVAVGPAAPTEPEPSTGKDNGTNKDDKPKDANSKKDNDSSNKRKPSTPNSSPANPSKPDTPSAPSQQPAPSKPSTPAPAPKPSPAPAPAPAPSTPPSSGGGAYWHASPAQAQAYAAGAAAQYGWTGQQFQDLIVLWDHESNWQWGAGNPRSGAYGIPQSLPGNNMAKYGDDWRDNAATQIDWGLYYIKTTYGNPSNAWQKWLSRCKPPYSGRRGWY